MNKRVSLIFKKSRAWVQEKRMLILYVVLALGFLAMVGVHMHSVLVAKTIVPIMDYWKWIAVYGQKVLDGTVSFVDWFNSDAGQHIHPLSLMLTFFMLKTFHFDVVPLVIAGMIIRILVAGTMMTCFVMHFRKEDNRPVALGLCALVIGFSVLNLNQWEATTQPFSLAFIFRIALFYLSFYLTERFTARIVERSARENLLNGAFLGLYCGLLTVFASSAYFVGHLVAIGLAILWCMWCNKRSFRKYLLPAFVWGALSLAGAIVYYVIVSGRAGYAAEEYALVDMLILLVEGVCCFWGSVFVHQNVTGAFGTAITAVVGAVFLLYVLTVTVLYMRKNRDGRSVFPLICVFYAVITSATISFGRVTVFGAGSLTASRYVVESTVGLLGAAWMSYDLLLKHSGRMLVRSGVCAFAACALLLLSCAALRESDMAIYRKAYNEGLRDKMLVIDTLSDEELGAFQANSPNDIRYCVEFFKENGLSVFRESK